MNDPDDGRNARAPEPDDVVRICRALNQAGARHLLIGGFAVVAHGAGRFTKAIDLLIDDTPANVARVKQGLAVLADNAASAVEEDDVRRHVEVGSHQRGASAGGCLARGQGGGRPGPRAKLG